LLKTIGIPRALLYYYYYPCWDTFFSELGFKIILSPQTNQTILNNGIKRAVDDLCLPFKVYFGHVEQLIKKEIDYLFVPRLISLGTKNNVCPKFMGLPDMLRSVFDDLPELLAPDIDLRKGFFPKRRIAHIIGAKLNRGFFDIEFAFRKAVKKQKIFEKIESEGFTPNESMKILDGKELEISRQNEGLNIAVLGHAYILEDEEQSMGIIKFLRKRRINVKTLEMIDMETREKSSLYSKKLFWIFNRQVMGAAYYYLFKAIDKVDGIIQVTAFGCGPDSFINELVELKGKSKNISILSINLDEHSGEGGLHTRLEAFIDLLKRKKQIL